jgi:hypothetical protein
MQTDGVLVTGARAPVAVHWAWALRASGYRVHLGDVQRYPLGHARGLSEGYLRFAAPRHDFAGFRRDILGLCTRHRITTIVPTCEEVFWLAAMMDDLTSAGITLFAPPKDILHRVHDKAAFVTLCQDFWPHLPQTRRLASMGEARAEAAAAGGLVFKPVYSRFATRTLIRPSAAAVATIQPTPADPWVAQEFLPGREVCAYAIATQGQVRALAVYHPRHRAGLGAGIYFDPVDPEPALAFVRAFCAATQWTGQVSFDLIEGAGGLYPIECNPRATSGLHLIRDAGGLTDAAFGAAEPLLIRSDVGAQCVKLAMWLYAGWPHRRRMPAFRADLARATEALRWADGRRIGLAGQLRAVIEIAGLALRRGQSLQQAATADVEWNGPDQH